MFVDEGFGSLDETSLSEAIAVLSGLSEGNRLVGIISHVDSLKTRISRKYPGHQAAYRAEVRPGSSPMTFDFSVKFYSGNPV